MRTPMLAALLAPMIVGCMQPMPAAHPDVARAEILETDRKFDQYSATHGIQQAFHAFVADDVVSLPAGENPVLGRGALYTAQANVPKNVSLRWEPRGADAAASGDLGYSWGIFTVTIAGDDGKTTVRHGKYCTIWKRQADGTWRAALDVGNAGPAPAPAPAPTPAAAPAPAHS